MMFRLKGNFSGTRSHGPSLPIAGARRWGPPLQEEVRTAVLVDAALSSGSLRTRPPSISMPELIQN